MTLPTIVLLSNSASAVGGWPAQCAGGVNDGAFVVDLGEYTGTSYSPGYPPIPESASSWNPEQEEAYGPTISYVITPSGYNCATQTPANGTLDIYSYMIEAEQVETGRHCINEGGIVSVDDCPIVDRDGWHLVIVYYPAMSEESWGHGDVPTETPQSLAGNLVAVASSCYQSPGEEYEDCVFDSIFHAVKPILLAALVLAIFTSSVTYVVNKARRFGREGGE
jgi:hypothetical protein